MKIWKNLRCTHAAYPGITVAVGQFLVHLPDHRRTKQVGMQEAVYVSKQKIANFDGKRAQWPESRRETDLDFARRGTYIKPKVTRSRNRGTGGKVTISARSA